MFDTRCLFDVLVGVVFVFSDVIDMMVIGFYMLGGMLEFSLLGLLFGVRF